MAVPAPTSAPPGFTPKGQRAWAFLEAHEQRMAERRGGLRDYHCGKCGVYQFSYVTPIGMVVRRCHECGDRFKFTTEQR